MPRADCHPHQPLQAANIFMMAGICGIFAAIDLEGRLAIEQFKTPSVLNRAVGTRCRQLCG